MIDGGPQPYDISATPMAGIGHNSRAFEIERTAQELRLAYLRANLRPGASPKWKIIHAAAVNPDLTADEFRQLVIYLGFSQSDLGSIIIGQKGMAALMKCSERTARTQEKSLEDKGWISVRRKRRAVSVKTAILPDRISKALAEQIFSAMNATGEVQDIVIPDTSIPALDRQPASVQEAGTITKNGTGVPVKASKSGEQLPVKDLRPATGCRLTKDNNNTPREAPPSSLLLEEDLARFYVLFKGWGEKPGQFFGKMGGISRTFSDDQFRGEVDSVKGHPAERVLEAALMTVNAMSARNAKQGTHQHGGGGFSSYFGQELRTTCGRLLTAELDRAKGSRAPPKIDPEIEKKRRELKKLGVELPT